MQIQNNLPSMNASRNQSISERKIRKSLEKLSSGFPDRPGWGMTPLGWQSLRE